MAQDFQNSLTPDSQLTKNLQTLYGGGEQYDWLSAHGCGEGCLWKSDGYPESDPQRDWFGRTVPR